MMEPNIDFDEHCPPTEDVTWRDFSKLYTKNNLGFLMMNARSIKNKFSEFVLYVTSLKAKATYILITETWLNECSDFMYEIPGYKSINYYRMGRNGGGMKLFLLTPLRSGLVPLAPVGPPNFVRYLRLESNVYKTCRGVNPRRNECSFHAL